jgi:preprotein translocase subunit SecG
MGILTTVISVFFFILCVLLVILILLQSDKGAGMGILGGSSQSAFGSSTADVITKATGVMVGLFMLGSVGLATLESSRVDSLKKELTKAAEEKKKSTVKTESKDAVKADAQKPAEPAKTEKGLPVK